MRGAARDLAALAALCWAGLLVSAEGVFSDATVADPFGMSAAAAALAAPEDAVASETHDASDVDSGDAESKRVAERPLEGPPPQNAHATPEVDETPVGQLDLEPNGSEAEAPLLPPRVETAPDGLSGPILAVEGVGESSGQSLGAGDLSSGSSGETLTVRLGSTKGPGHAVLSEVLKKERSELSGGIKKERSEPTGGIKKERPEPSGGIKKERVELSQGVDQEKSNVSNQGDQNASEVFAAVGDEPSEGSAAGGDEALELFVEVGEETSRVSGEGGDELSDVSMGGGDDQSTLSTGEDMSEIPLEISEPSEQIKSIVGEPVETDITTPPTMETPLLEAEEISDGPSMIFDAEAWSTTPKAEPARESTEDALEALDRFEPTPEESLAPFASSDLSFGALVDDALADEREESHIEDGRNARSPDRTDVLHGDAPVPPEVPGLEGEELQAALAEAGEYSRDVLDDDFGEERDVPKLVDRHDSPDYDGYPESTPTQDGATYDAYPDGLPTQDGPTQDTPTHSGYPQDTPTQEILTQEVPTQDDYQPEVRSNGTQDLGHDISNALNQMDSPDETLTELGHGGLSGGSMSSGGPVRTGEPDIELIDESHMEEIDDSVIIESHVAGLAPVPDVPVAAPTGSDTSLPALGALSQVDLDKGPATWNLSVGALSFVRAQARAWAALEPAAVATASGRAGGGTAAPGGLAAFALAPVLAVRRPARLLARALPAFARGTLALDAAALLRGPLLSKTALKVALAYKSAVLLLVVHKALGALFRALRALCADGALAPTLLRRVVETGVHDANLLLNLHGAVLAMLERGGALRKHLGQSAAPQRGATRQALQVYATRVEPRTERRAPELAFLPALVAVLERESLALGGPVLARRAASLSDCGASYRPARGSPGRAAQRAECVYGVLAADARALEALVRSEAQALLAPLLAKDLVYRRAQRARADALGARARAADALLTDLAALLPPDAAFVADAAALAQDSPAAVKALLDAQLPLLKHLVKH